MLQIASSLANDARNVELQADGRPVGILGKYIFQYIGTLLGMSDECYIREACNILKVWHYDGSVYHSLMPPPPSPSFGHL